MYGNQAADARVSRVADLWQRRVIKIPVLLLVLAAGAQLFASDALLLKVTNYTVESGLYVIHATDAGNPIELLCNQDSPYCSLLKPGEYWMVDWTVPLIAYEGPFTCKEVDVYAKTGDGERGKKLGEYCVVENVQQQSGLSSPSETKATNSASTSKSRKPDSKHQ